MLEQFMALVVYDKKLIFFTNTSDINWIFLTNKTAKRLVFLLTRCDATQESNCCVPFFFFQGAVTGCVLLQKATTFFLDDKHQGSAKWDCQPGQTILENKVVHFYWDSLCKGTCKDKTHHLHFKEWEENTNIIEALQYFLQFSENKIMHLTGVKAKYRHAWQ